FTELSLQSADEPCYLEGIHGMPWVYPGPPSADALLCASPLWAWSHISGYFNHLRRWRGATAMSTAWCTAGRPLKGVSVHNILQADLFHSGVDGVFQLFEDRADLALRLVHLLLRWGMCVHQ